MKLPASLFSFFIPSALSAALPPCSGDSQTPCSCPSGSEHHQSSTFTVIGAPAADVKAVTSDFFDTAWQGFKILETSGPDNEVGSTRTLKLKTEDGVYDSIEQVKLDPCWSFFPAITLRGLYIWQVDIRIS